jgi:16S rRNA (adenine1518-N6/adenine1519-N6)-dimethyltransferase
MYSVSRPSELRSFLESLGVKAKKSLSQNFLIDRNILRKIVQVADIQEGEKVLEIGSGPGALTEFLVNCGAQVTAVEKDERFAESLQQRFPQVNVFKGDIREFDLESSGYSKVVANLPYHLTSPILELLVPRQDLFSSLTLMVQKEVGQRMTADACSPHYSSLSLFLRFYSDPTYSFLVSNNCFFPQPKVQSAVIHLKLRAPPQVSSRKDFLQFVRFIFNQRRKMVRTTLKAIYPLKKIEEALLFAKISLEERPERIALEQLIQLFETLS